MILDDGKGIVIDTDSRPLDMRRQLLNSQAEIEELIAQVKRMPRSKQRQQLKNQIDSKLAAHKRMLMKYMREQSSAASQKPKQGDAF